MIKSQLKTEETQFKTQDFYEIMNVIETVLIDRSDSIDQDTTEYYLSLMEKLSKIADRTHMKNQVLQVVRVKVKEE